MTRQDASNMFMRVAERLGVPCAVLAAFMWAAWYFGTRALDEVIVPVSKRHIEFVDEVSSTNKSVADTAAKNAVTQSQISESLKKFSGLLEEYYGQHAEVKTHVEGQE